jgi:aldose sugar dehydrogenase
MKGSNLLTTNNKTIQKLEKSWTNHVAHGASPVLLSISTISLFYLCSFSFLSNHVIFGQIQNQSVATTGNQTTTQPYLVDPSLKVEMVSSGFDFPTSMAFLGKDDILLLEKNTGNVLRILHGKVSHLLLHIDVSFERESGLLGIAISGNETKSSADIVFVYLYYTECKKDNATGSRDCGNYVYRFKLDAMNNKLIAPKLILTLPGLPGTSHDGGKLLMDKEKNLFVTIGDLQPTKFNRNMTGYDTKAQNIMNGTSPDGRAGILQITQDGTPVGTGILDDSYPLNLYYAYGIRNSFGIGFDPLTDNLWDTENGPLFGDEINLVKPGFNSGWEKVQGIWKLNQTREKEAIFDDSNKEVEFVNFTGKGKYSNPEFVWDKTVAPTALVFLNSDKLGQQYKNDIFVGSTKGTIFHFDLTPDRESLDLTGDLADLVYSKKEESSKIVFGKNFGIITDLKGSPYDGYLYIVSGGRPNYHTGVIYRIVPNS